MTKKNTGTKPPKTTNPAPSKAATKPAASTTPRKTPPTKSTLSKAAKKPTVPKTSRKTPPKRKNVSQTIPNGRTLQTRDERFEGDKYYRKPGYENKGDYRRVTVVDSNRRNELVVVKLTTSKKGKQLETYQKGKSKYRPYVETKDDDGNPIKIGKKFKENPPSKDVPMKEIAKIKKDTFKTSRQAENNRKKVRKLKNR